MGVARHEHAGGDWLDVCCWRCGSADAALDSLGRRLCPPCQADLSDAPSTPPDDPLRAVRSAYWDAHVLERCWRCLTESVDPDDEVGLCRSCFASLMLADTAGTDAPSRERSPARSAEDPRRPAAGAGWRGSPRTTRTSYPFW